MYKRCTINFVHGLDRTTVVNNNIIAETIGEYADSFTSGDIVIENLFIVSEQETYNTTPKDLNFSENYPDSQSSIYTADDDYANDFTNLDNSNTSSNFSRDNTATPIKVTYHKPSRKRRLPLGRLHPNSPHLSDGSYWNAKSLEKESIKTINNNFEKDEDRHKIDNYNELSNNDKLSNHSINSLFEISDKRRKLNNSKVSIENTNEEIDEHRKDIRHPRIEVKSVAHNKSSGSDLRKKRQEKIKSEEKEKKDSIFMNFLYVFEIFSWFKDSDIIVRLIIAAVAGILVFGTIFTQMQLLSNF